MFSSRQPFNFAQYYATQGAFGNDPVDPGSWHAPSSPYASSCARSGSYEDWSPVTGLGQPSSPACSHASSPGNQVGYSYPLPPGHQQGVYGGRLTPPSSAEFTSGPTNGLYGGLQGHFVFPDLPAPASNAPPQQACSPDSGVALGSDGGVVSGSESPTLQSIQQQHLVSVHYTTVTADHPALEPANGIHTGPACLLGSSSRPQPARSPFEWIKKPSYQIQVQPGKTRTKDKYRVVYTDHQRLELEKEFHYSRYITIRRKAELAAMLGLSERQVKIWFQNRRAKERKQTKKREELQRKEFVSADYMLKLEPDSVLSLCPPTSCTV